MSKNFEVSEKFQKKTTQSVPLNTQDAVFTKDIENFLPKGQKRNNFGVFKTNFTRIVVLKT